MTAFINFIVYISFNAIMNVKATVSLNDQNQRNAEYLFCLVESLNWSLNTVLKDKEMLPSK